MAKELPYFKFEPNQWENGNIQMCSRDLKGLFIDLCALYWSRLGELPYALALQKHCNGSKDALQTLEDLQIITVTDGQIIIDFLDEQLDEFQETSEKRRKAANKRWSNASVLQVQSKSNAIREDKKREDKKREDKAPTVSFKFKESMIYHGFNPDLVDDWLKVRKNKKASNTKTALEAFVREANKAIGDNYTVVDGQRVIEKDYYNDILKLCVERSWAGFKSEWYNKEKKESNETGTKTNWREEAINDLLGTGGQ
jgi:hypothetical protein